MAERRQSKIAEAAEAAARRYERYKDRVRGKRPSSDKQLRVLKRDADRAKLALHRNHDDG